MKKNISNDLTLFFTLRYPYKSVKTSKKKNLIYIGIGGNVGDTKRIFNKLFEVLKGDARFDILQTAPILKNPPFGFLEQNDFYNSVIVLKSDLSAMQSLREFQRLEKRFKRIRSFKDAPRTLDIDILFLNSQKINLEKLIVPHPKFYERISVLLPLQFVLSV